MTEQAAGQQPEQQFQLQRIFLKDLSYEAPKTPQLFKEQWKPEVNLEVNLKVSHQVASLVSLMNRMKDNNLMFKDIKSKEINQKKFQLMNLSHHQL